MWSMCVPSFQNQELEPIVGVTSGTQAADRRSGLDFFVPKTELASLLNVIEVALSPI
jgi:hypothetical protein